MLGNLAPRGCRLRTARNPVSNTGPSIRQSKKDIVGERGLFSDFLVSIYNENYLGENFYISDIIFGRTWQPWTQGSLHHKGCSSTTTAAFHSVSDARAMVDLARSTGVHACLSFDLHPSSTHIRVINVISIVVSNYLPIYRHRACSVYVRTIHMLVVDSLSVHTVSE